MIKEIRQSEEINSIDDNLEYKIFSGATLTVKENVGNNVKVRIVGSGNLVVKGSVGENCNFSSALGNFTLNKVGANSIITSQRGKVIIDGKHIQSGSFDTRNEKPAAMPENPIPNINKLEIETEKQKITIKNSTIGLFSLRDSEKPLNLSMKNSKAASVVVGDMNDVKTNNSQLQPNFQFKSTAQKNSTTNQTASVKRGVEINNCTTKTIILGKNILNGKAQTASSPYSKRLSKDGYLKIENENIEETLTLNM